MDLTSGYPLYLIETGLPVAYPKLEENITTEVVIAGGGISGALTAYYLTKAGIDCVLLDSRTIGTGSTAATSFLQYELDKPLSELSRLIGNKNATRVYTLCSEAIDTLSDISKAIKFARHEKSGSLYFAAFKKDIPFFAAEFKARKKAGFDVELLAENEIEKQFGFKAPAAIYSTQAASTNAYTLTHALLNDALKKGLHVFDRTTISEINYRKRSVLLKTENGFTVRAKKMVNATGYEVIDFIDKKILSLHSTYAFASENNEAAKDYLIDKTLFWNSADPYLYFRRTNDNRLLMGGRDEAFSDPIARDKLIKKKTELLSGDFKKLFPQSEFIPEFSWTGTFASTKDSLPYIGTYSKTPNTYYALGFGGNGITFSILAAEIITDLIKGKKNRDQHLFKFDR